MRSYEADETAAQNLVARWRSEQQAYLDSAPWVSVDSAESLIQAGAHGWLIGTAEGAVDKPTAQRLRDLATAIRAVELAKDVRLVRHIEMAI